MENAELDEPDKKRPHLSINSPPMARNSILSPDSKSVFLSLFIHVRLILIELLKAFSCW